MNAPANIDPKLLAAVSTFESIGVLTAFALAVARTHPNPEALAESFEFFRKSSEAEMAKLPGRDGPEFVWAKGNAQTLASTLMKAIIRR